MSAAYLYCIFATRILTLSFFTTGLILANVSPAVAATTATAADKAIKPDKVVSPTPKAATGALRILLVDDDGSDNNNIPGDKRNSVSDTVFRKLVSDAVGGNAASWAIEAVKTNASGPSLDKLRQYSLIMWYTGASYGGNSDNTSVLSIEDEKTVRRYLEETGGAVILISPGYASKVLEQGSTWEESSWPFLNEVLGIRGGKGLAQRFKPGTVSTTQGTQFQVGKGAAVESQFSAVNPGRATVVFTAALDDMKDTGQPTPVATAFSYGRGRIIYVGFTFENLAAKDLAPAFQKLLAASGVGTAATAAAPSEALVTDAPKTFTVTGSGRDSFNFSASSAGAIRVQVQSRGVPVTVAVLHPDGRTVEHTGSGGFAFDDLSSAADLAKGHVWAVTVRTATLTADTAVAASGSVVVSHPPSDQTAVKAQLNIVSSRTQVLKTATINSTTLKPSSIGTAITPAPAQDTTMVFDRENKTVKSAPTPPPPPPPAGLAGPMPVLQLDKLTGSMGTPLKARGSDLFPPGTPVRQVMDKSRGEDYFNAELHFVYGSQVIVATMKADETSFGNTRRPNETETDPTLYYVPRPGTQWTDAFPARDFYERWYTGVVPNIPVTIDTVVTVYLKTKDGRPSNRMNFTYQPQPPQDERGMSTDTLYLPYDGNLQFTDATLASSYPNVSTRHTMVENGRVSRDTFLLGFSGYDTFFNTLELKNGWKVKECVLILATSMGSGAEITECRQGTTSPFVKIRWYMDPTFVLPNELTYTVRILVSGRVGSWR